MLTQPLYDPYESLERPLAVVASSTCFDSYELAKEFAQNGHDLIVAASNPSVVEEAEDFKEFGIDAVSFQIDLSTAEGVEQLYRRIIATGRPVEAIVINAGLSEDFSQESDLAKRILKVMINRGRGHILMTGQKNNEHANLICEDLQKEAEGTGVIITCLSAGVNTRELSRVLH